MDNIIYDKDGKIKPFYILSAERDIKETQIKSDEDELEYKYRQGSVSKEDYLKEKENLEFILSNQNKIYNDLIFMEIDRKDVNEIREEIKKASLNKIDLQRLSISLTSIIEKKLNDFKKNNDNFGEEDLNTWNFKYNRLASIYSKIREVEGFIQDSE